MRMTRRVWSALLIGALFLFGCNVLFDGQAEAPVSTTTAGSVSDPTPRDPSTETAPVDLESIAIQEPGLGSRLVGSVRLRGTAGPTHEQHLGLRLLAPQGEILAEGSAQIEAPVGERGEYQGELNFSVDEEQPGMVQVFSRSARDGKITHMTSTPVLLAPSGEAEIRTDLIPPETILIHAPESGVEVAEGSVNVRGRSLGLLEGALVIEVQNADGGIVGQKILTLGPASVGGPAEFDTEVGYAVQEESPGRILIREPNSLFGRAIHISTVEIILQP